MLQMPQEERPRERLLREGIDALALHELLAIVLTTGTKQKSVLQLAEEIVTSFGSLEGLLNATIPELMKIKGIGRAKAIQLKAIFGMVQKCRKIPFTEKIKIKTPRAAFDQVLADILEEKQEIAIVLLRDVKGHLIHKQQIALGTLSEVLIHPREVFYPAVRYKASSLILVHNHPSGDPSPSRADLELTRLLINASRVMGIPLTDHLIVTPTAFVSLREQGYLGPSLIY